MPRIEDLQRNVRDLQGVAALPDELQRLLQGLQTQLSTLRKAQPARRPRIPQVDPTPPDVPLQGNLLAIYQAVVQLHRAFCQYSGEVNRDQWIRMLDVAADAVAAYAGTGGGYVMEAPVGAQQPWTRNGATESWVAAVGEAPQGVLQPWMRDGQVPGWVPAYQGVTDGSNAIPGQIGEVRTQSGLTPVPVIPPTGGAYAVVTTLNLTPGDWDVFSNLYFMFVGNGGTVQNPGTYWATLMPSSVPLGSTDSTLASAGVAWMGMSSPALVAPTAGGSIGPVRMNISAAAGIDIRVIVVGTGGVAQVDWAVTARRMR